MGMQDFRFDGKRVLVVGGATGMGASAAQTAVELGGEVIVMDVAEVRFAVLSPSSIRHRCPAVTIEFFVGYDRKTAQRSGSACFRASYQGLVPLVNMLETVREVSKT